MNFFLKNLFIFIVLSIFISSCSIFGGGKMKIQPRYHLKKGDVFLGSKRITHSGGKIVDFAMAPDEKHLVIVTRSNHPKASTEASPVPLSMWVLDIKQKIKKEVASWVKRDPNSSCCIILKRGIHSSNLSALGYQKTLLRAFGNGLWTDEGFLAVGNLERNNRINLNLLQMDGSLLIR